MSLEYCAFFCICCRAVGGDGLCHANLGWPRRKDLKAAFCHRSPRLLTPWPGEQHLRARQIMDTLIADR